MMKKLIQLLFLQLICGVCFATVPNGALVNNYTQEIINESPVASDITSNTNGNYKWFSGTWWDGYPALTNYYTTNGSLAISFVGSNIDIVSAPLNSAAGIIPLLSGSQGFYVEFDMWISDTNSDHGPAVWLLARQHDLNLDDHYSGDPTGYERWMELDCEEGGWNANEMLATVHSWTGISPSTTSTENPNNNGPNPFNLGVKNTFGVSYNPFTSTTSWWINGVQQFSAGSPYVPAIASQQTFYLILSAYSHGSNLPYTMYVSGVRAWIYPNHVTVNSGSGGVNIIGVSSSPTSIIGL
jgi:hypothetical protein